MKTALLARRRKVAAVDLGDGDVVHVAPMTAGQLAELQARVKAAPEADQDLDALVWFAVFGVCDPDGTPAFAADDFPAVKGGVPFADLEAIGEAVNRINGFKKAAKGDQKKG